MKDNIIIGFEYCENEENFIGTFKTKEDFLNYTKRRLKSEKDEEVFDLKKKVNERLDWGMDCIFKTNYYGRITQYGYKISTIQGQ